LAAAEAGGQLQREALDLAAFRLFALDGVAS
jgi:hypothetical protein